MHESRTSAEWHDSFQRMVGQPPPERCWWTEPERVSIAEAVQGAARCALCNRLQAAGPADIIAGEHDHSGALPGPIIDVIHLLTRFESSLDNHWYDSVLQVLQPEAFVELLGVMNVTMSLRSMQGDVGLPEAPPESRPVLKQHHPKGLQLEVGWADGMPIAQAS